MKLVSRSLGRAAALTAVTRCVPRRVAPVLLAGLVLMLALTGPAMATPLLPSTGVNISAMVSEVVTSLGAIVAVIVAAFFAFLLIRKALRWARSGF